MKRSEVNIEQKWRKEDIFASIADWESMLSQVNKDMVGVLKFKNRLGIKESLLQAFEFCDEIGKRFEKLGCYAMFYRDENLTDTKASELVSRYESVAISFNSYSSFMSSELAELDELTLQSFIDDSAFFAWEYSLKMILKKKKHILSAGEERILALAGKTTGAFRDIFSQIDNVDLPLGKITVDGKREQMTHGKYSLFLQHKDSAVRRKAFMTMYDAVGSLINTIAANYSSSVNKDNFIATARHYDSALEKSLSANDVPVSVYDTLVKKVNQNLDAVSDYMGFRKQTLNTEKMHMYDLYVPLYSADATHLEYEDAYDLVIKALKPMGEEYVELLKSARENRWIDVQETENKRSGAYSCGVYGCHPYVLLNYTKTTHDIFTIAHEMGHAIHSYYSAQNQPYAKNDYSIFVAEVASTVNEVLLLKHLIANAEDVEFKKYLLSYYLDMFRTTLFRQTMFAEFESQVHKMEAGGTPLTVQSMNKLYYKLNKKYYGTNVYHDKQIAFEWARIPHFYRAFYVYQYASGLTSAVNIANMILSNGESAVARYKEFLSSGGKKSPYEILKDVGVDLGADEAYEVAFGEFRDTLASLKALSEQN